MDGLKSVNFLEAFKANETKKVLGPGRTFSPGEMKRIDTWYTPALLAEYSIIEDPMEFWVNIYPTYVSVFHGERMARNNCDKAKGGVTKKFREVL